MTILTYSGRRGETNPGCRSSDLIMIRRRATALFAAALFAAFAADPEPRWRELNRIAREAVQAKNYVKLRETLLALRPLLPGNPRIAYNLAASEAMLGNRDAALAELGNLAAMGVIYDLSADTDFAWLRALPGFQAVTDRIAAARKPVSRSSLAFAIAPPDLIPEDIAYDPASRRYFYSSVRRGRIYTAGGQEFAHSDWSIFALRADPARRLLWATTGWVAQCEACKPEDKDKTALLAFDLDSGALKQRIESPVPGLLGDMTLSPAGDIFVCEGLRGAIFRLAAGAKELARLDSPGEFPSPQTPALSADGKTFICSGLRSRHRGDSSCGSHCGMAAACARHRAQRHRRAVRRGQQFPGGTKRHKSASPDALLTRLEAAGGAGSQRVLAWRADAWRRERPRILLHRQRRLGPI
jgi:hypothetical protein